MQTPELSIGRHGLAWLDPARLDLNACAVCTPEARAVFDRWLARGWPMVIRRYQPGDDPQLLPLGIALPPQEGKQRIGVSVPLASVREMRSPLQLRHALAAAPENWRRDLLLLDRQLQAIGVAACVYGSLAWQALTGQNYFTEHSDVDLLSLPASHARLEQLIATLLAWENETGRRADGEVLLPGNRAVAWREMAQGAEQVLAKYANGFQLIPRHELMATLLNEEAVL